MQIFHYVKQLTLLPDEHSNTDISGRRHKRSVASSKLWDNASTLRISFVPEVSAELRYRMERVIRQWEPFVSLAFDFVEDGKGDIRIANQGKHSQSSIGRQALRVDKKMPTLTIAVKPDDSDFDRTLLHEFGHALGFQHAHLHPNADIQWNKPAIYKYFSEVHGWSNRDVVHNLFEINDWMIIHGRYDKNSIMHYHVPNFMTLNNWETGINKTLSEGDKLFARAVYPPINYRKLPI
jgi:hypothetical protein